ncbi:hypothetical protein ABBQ32_001708 [Trebouxia sp. C0010 RCD-2024]
MDSARQIGIQLPEGLQRLQLHLFANGLVGWSPETETTISHAAQVDPNRNDSSGGRTAQTVPPLLSLSCHMHHLNLNRSAEDTTEDEQGTDADSSSSELGDFADVASDSSEDEEAGSDSSQHGYGQGMTDEEQIEAVQAFIVGDDTENPELIEAACMAATQLVSSLADSSAFIEPEVIDKLLELAVHLHAVEGGLQLKIGHGVLARSIYIYGDDEEDSAGIDDCESEESFAGHAASSSGRTVVAGRAAAEEGVSCPVCLSSYSSNLRMAALGCHHHVCYTCFGRLSRPKLCPLCRAHIASHVEVIL